MYLSSSVSRSETFGRQWLCFHKLLCAPNWAQDEIRLFVEDKQNGKRIEVAHPSLFLSSLLTGSVESL